VIQRRSIARTLGPQASDPNTTLIKLRQLGEVPAFQLHMKRRVASRSFV
jgi:hypothetical protein